MGARDIIGLEAALAELGQLYTIANRYAALAADAESELLPHLERVAARLRSRLRGEGLDPATVDAVAEEVSDLRSRWRSALENLRASPAYRAALAAWGAGDAPALRDLLPRIFAGLAATPAPPPLFCGVSVSSGRRRPGSSPFLTPAAAADRIADLQREGVPLTESGEWWDTELAYHVLFDDPEADESPITLRLAGDRRALPLFRVAAEPLYRVYAPAIAPPFSVVLQHDAEDEWWQAYDGGYAEFRDGLAAELRARGIDTNVS